MMADRRPPGLVDAAHALAEVLGEENAALARLDLAGAAGLLARKTGALESLLATAPPNHTVSVLRDLGAGLATLAAENRRLLERAILVQGRVIGCIARAVPRALAGNASGYGRDGGLAQPRRQAPVALSAHA